MQSPISQSYQGSRCCEILCKISPPTPVSVEGRHYPWTKARLALERLPSWVIHEKQNKFVFSFYNLKPQGGLDKQDFTEVLVAVSGLRATTPLFSYFSSSSCQVAIEVMLGK